MKKILCLCLVLAAFGCADIEDTAPIEDTVLETGIDNVKSDPKPKIIFEDPLDVDADDG